MNTTIIKIFRSYVETTGKTKTFFVVLFGVISSVLTILEPIIFTLIISQIELFYQSGIFDSDLTVKYIIFWALFIVASIFIQYIYRYVFVYKNNMNNYVELCKKFNKNIVHMGFAEYIGKKQGSLYKIYDRGTLGQESFLYFFFGDVIRSFSSIIAIVAILFYTDYRMALLSLSMIPIMLILGVFFIRKLSIKQKILNDRWDEMFGTIGNILSSFMLTKSINREPWFLKEMSGNLDTILIEQNSLGKGWSFVNVYTGFLVMIARILVIGFGVYFVVNGSLSFASLFLVFSYIGWIYFPLSFMIDRFNDIVKDITSVEKMYDELEGVEQENIDIGKVHEKINGNIEFKNINFGYSPEKQILKNISLTVKKGQKIALVGNTGAGKSTIVNLLLRFWDVDSGEILLDGININSLKKSSLRNHIGVVSQDNSLFNLSIEENLKFANPDASEADLRDALQKAEADFVFTLKDGIKTVIGERGLKLSGGEKQRISIARLFLKNPEILLLDEATSALDNKTENLIQTSLDRLMQGKTSIIIAHRLSTIQHADIIYMLEDGEVVESGNYENLMNRKQKFFELANPEKLILG